MKKIMPILAVLVVGILVLSGLGAAAVSSDTLKDNQSSDEVESVLQNEDLDSLLSSYGLDTEDTMGEFEQLLYNLVYKRWWRYPRLAAELMNDIAELSDILEQIGVKDDMTIAEALPIIENNKELLQKIGINLFCSIHMGTIVGGGCWPPFRYYTALYGIWETGFHCGVTIKGLIGLQYIQCNFCKERYSGVFIGMIGSDPPVINYYPCPVDGWQIRGDFTLFSRSNVPFVNSSGGSQQTQCPCNQQGNLQNNNMQSSSQQSSTSSSSQILQLVKIINR